MKYESLVSIKNLKLAWRRINTSRNMPYKRFFRPVYLAYEAGLQDNLRLLKKELLTSWKPSPPTRTYVPKPNGLQRPITILNLEDQIVFQAIANIFAEKLRKRRKKVEHKTVFSNVLNQEEDSIFFVDRWQETYQEFQKACGKHFTEGYRWVAHFDLAAYYDTISHTQLVRLVSPRGGHSRTAQKVQEWLRVWTTYDGSPTTSHGIPQGPVASDFLAEAFFLPIDEQMSKLDIRYTRYVDDIRIFGKTQAAVQKATIELEWACQNHGLIPQGKKFDIKEAINVEEVLGQLPSIPPEGEGKVKELSKSTAESIFRQALYGRPLRINNKSKVRYALYRAQKSEKILRWVLALIPSHPEHIDAFYYFLSNYERSNRIIRVIEGILDRGMPYPYVRGQLWQMVTKLADNDYLKKRRSVALREYKSATNDVTHRWGLLVFLLRCEREGIGRVSRRLLAEHNFVQMLLVQDIPDRQYEKDKVVVKLLKQRSLEPSLMIGRSMRERRLRLQDFDMRSRDIKDKAQNVFKGLGIIRRRVFSDRDYIGEIISRLYGCPVGKCWKKLFGTEYEYGIQLLLEAEAAFQIDRSGWMRNQNSFNDMFVRKYIEELKLKGLPGGNVKLISQDEKLVKFGSLVQKGAPLDRHYPEIISGFREFNKRRNELPDSHPFNMGSGAKNKVLTSRERNKFAKILSEVFAYFIENFEG